MLIGFVINHHLLFGFKQLHQNGDSTRRIVSIMKELSFNTGRNGGKLLERETHAGTINYEKHSIEDFFYSKKTI